MEQVFTNLTGGGPISVYVKDGKVVRVRPLQVPEEEYKPWVIEAGRQEVFPAQGVASGALFTSRKETVWELSRIPRIAFSIR